MADLTITAAQVEAGATAKKLVVTAGETITAGQLVYTDSADDGKYKKCDASSAAYAEVAGVALNGASDDQPLSILTYGSIDPGATVSVGYIYVVSRNSGAIAPVTDLASADFVSVVGIGTTSSNIEVKLIASGVALP